MNKRLILLFSLLLAASAMGQEAPEPTAQDEIIGGLDAAQFAGVAILNVGVIGVCTLLLWKAIRRFSEPRNFC